MNIDQTRGFVAFPRGLTEWEWYTDANTARVFFHLLLTANWKDKPWQGITVHAGQLVTSRAHLAQQLGISEQSVRTALKHLKSTGCITIRTGPKYSVLTIQNYEQLVGFHPLSSQQTTSCPPAANHNLTITTTQQTNQSSPPAEDAGPTKTTALLEEAEQSIGRLSPTGKAELAGYAERLGEELMRTILHKCVDTGGRSWAYVRKALIEAEAQGCKSAEEYRLTHPMGAGRNLRVDRVRSPSPAGAAAGSLPGSAPGNDFLANCSLERSLSRLKGKKAAPG